LSIDQNLPGEDHPSRLLAAFGESFFNEQLIEPDFFHVWKCKSSIGNLQSAIMSGLYIHIPFCEKKCAYCDFFSIPKPWENETPFFQSLDTEINDIKSRYPGFLPETIFIGGGTPTAPGFQCLEKFLPMLGRFSPQEFSCEANPGTVDAAKLALLKRSGVNRLSIGVQSFDFHCLETLGRIHSAEQAEEAFRLARAAGFENISLDLIFGVPGQSMAMLEADLDRALALNPEHIAIYNLIYEEGTPLTARNPQKLDEELEREMYDRIRARLKEAGFIHYEISNFAKPGFECRHNLLYWTGGEYIGCGPAAHSHWKGVRWANVADLDDYCRGGGSPGLSAAALAKAGGVALPKKGGSVGDVALPMEAKLSGRARPPGEPLPKRKKLPHEIPSWVQQGARHFITINCKTRDSEKLIDHAGQLLKSAEYYEQIGRWYLWLMVIMPDHIHFIATFKLSDGLQKIISSWKRYQTISMGIEWQSDFFEHRLRNETEFDEKCQYIRMNPVRKGLSATPEEWPHVLDRISINNGSPGGVALPMDAKLSGGARPPGEPKRVPAQQSTAAPPEVSPYQKNAEFSGRASLSERAADWPRREFEEMLDPEAKERETLAMGLRLLAGIEVSSNLWKKREGSFQWLEKQGLLVIEGHHVRLSDEALFVSDSVFAELV
jgi:oxygen-independent coproporphyrinogen-3 oxidase